MNTRLAWGLSLLSLPVLFLDILMHGFIRQLGNPPLASGVYAATYAIAATCFELRWSRKLLRAVIPVVVGVLFCATFDLVMIFLVTLSAGVFAVGTAGRSDHTFGKSVRYRLLRAGVAGGLLLVACLMNLPVQRLDGPGSITNSSLSFAVMTALPLLGMLLVDGITLLIFGRNFGKGGKSAKAAGSKPLVRPPQR